MSAAGTTRRRDESPRGHERKSTALPSVLPWPRARRARYVLARRARLTDEGASSTVDQVGRFSTDA